MHERLLTYTEQLESQSKQLAREVGQRERAQSRLEHDAFHDALTGLPNRRWFKQQLDQAAERDEDRAVLFIDLDNFKVVNDSLGHDAGDELLVVVAERLSTCLEQISRPGARGSVARLGGDEFVVLLPAADASDAAAQIQSALGRPLKVRGQTVTVSASIGIATNQEVSTENDLLRDADTAMYRAKLGGKSQHALFDQSMHDAASSRLSLENDLREAVESGDFTLNFQPIVSLTTARIASFEALLRWNRPEHGPVSPAVFIPIAEQTGLIIPMGAWVLREACHELARINALRPPDDRVSMAVNVSRRQLLSPGFIEEVKQTLHVSGVHPANLTLEVTESLVMSDPVPVRKTLQQLRDAGLRISMDDFGTGYSSLSCLREIPLNVIKIDQSFVARLGPDVQHVAILDTIMSLARHLRLDVVAEGIETNEQLAQILALSCTYGQGYLFSKPVPAAAARQLANTRFDIRHAA